MRVSGAPLPETGHGAYRGNGLPPGKEGERGEPGQIDTTCRGRGSSGKEHHPAAGAARHIVAAPGASLAGPVGRDGPGEHGVAGLCRGPGAAAGGCGHGRGQVTGTEHPEGREHHGERGARPVPLFAAVAVEEGAGVHGERANAVAPAKGLLQVLCHAPQEAGVTRPLDGAARHQSDHPTGAGQVRVGSAGVRARGGGAGGAHIRCDAKAKPAFLKDRVLTHEEEVGRCRDPERLNHEAARRPWCGLPPWARRQPGTGSPGRRVRSHGRRRSRLPQTRRASPA